MNTIHIRGVRARREGGYNAVDFLYAEQDEESRLAQLFAQRGLKALDGDNDSVWPSLIITRENGHVTEAEVTRILSESGCALIRRMGASVPREP